MAAHPTATAYDLASRAYDLAVLAHHKDPTPARAAAVETTRAAKAQAAYQAELHQLAA
jgi:hypothetical protein